MIDHDILKKNPKQRVVTRQGLEEKRGETGDQEATLEEAEEKEQEKCVGEKTRDNSSTDNMDGKRIRPGMGSRFHI